MHVRDLIELAAHIVTHSANILRSKPRATTKVVDSYWSHSKRRHDHWMRAIQDYSAKCESGSAAERTVAWQYVRVVLEEILASEILTRVFSALISHWDLGAARDEFTPVTRSVFLSQNEARNRALNVMVYGQGSTLAEAVALNRLRRRVEKWNDVLIGALTVQFDARPFAFDSDRATAYAEDFAASANDLWNCPSWRLLQSSLTVAFRDGISNPALSAPQNRGIGQSVIATLPADCLDGHPAVRTLWHECLDDAARNAIGLIEEALLEGFDVPAAPALYRYDAASQLRSPRY